MKEKKSLRPWPTTLTGHRKEGDHKMTNNAIVTLTRGEQNWKEARYTHPTFERYARKTGAKLIVIDKGEFPPIGFYLVWRQIFLLLEQYERILYIDTDCLIAPECPNLFEIVPQDKLGIHILPLTPSFAEDMKNIQRECGQIGWIQTYFSTGVFLASRIHRVLFDEKNYLNYPSKYYPAQTETNYNAQRLKIKLFDIGEKLECIGPRSNRQRWRTDLSRFSAYIIHYPGNWFYKKQRIHDIKWDSRIMGLPRFSRRFFAALLLLARITAHYLRLLKINFMRFGPR